MYDIKDNDSEAKELPLNEESKLFFFFFLTVQNHSAARILTTHI